MSITRRQFIGAAPGVIGGASMLSACASGSDPQGYEALAARIRRTGPPADRGTAALQQELIRYATLAPSSHNTQCWKFAFENAAISILPDPSRRCPAVDPDDHHMYVSLGCATENLVQAAQARGFQAEPGFDAARDAVHVRLAPAPAVDSPLFRAIATRQCTRGDYDGRSVSNEDLRLLEQAGTSDRVRMLLWTDRPAIERVLNYVIEANTLQMANPAFIKELKSWIRFNAAAAVRTRDGLYSATLGSPNIPTWIGDLAFRWLLTPHGENDKYTRQIRTSAGVAVFIARSADNAGWVEVGRCYERFALQATVIGIRTAHLNQPVEVPSVRPAFATAIGLGGQRPDLVVRFGRGPELPPSLRRPVRDVLI